ncbi:MAG: hypothetical protein HGB04_06700 [Chlorobiaceae bacterium]|nr:hypothetical protein [Chlorobiaceae bacterium]
MATERGMLKQKLDAVGEQLHVVASDRRSLEAAVLDQLLAMPPDVCIAPRLAGYFSRRNLEITGDGSR